MTSTSSLSFRTHTKRLNEVINNNKENSPVNSPVKSPKRQCFTSEVIPRSLTSLTSGWNFFIPLAHASLPFEIPGPAIQSMTNHIFSIDLKGVAQIPKGVIQKIVELAHILQPHAYVSYKRNQAIEDLDKLTSIRLPVSFFMVSLPEHVYGCVSLRELIFNNSNVKVKYAVGFVFKRINNSIQFENIFKTVKHVTCVPKPSPACADPLDRANYLSKVKRLKTRIQASADLQDTSHVVTSYFQGTVKKTDRLKCVMMAPLYSGDLFSYNQKGQLSDERRRFNTLLIAEQIGLALQGIHAKGYVHRDIKEENVLANWNAAGLLEKVALHDLELCCTTKADDPSAKETCGTLEYASPEMQARALKCEAIFKALEIEDPLTLMGPSLDTWGYGLLLYIAYYQKVPDDVQEMLNFNTCQKHVEIAETPEAVAFFTQEGTDCITKWKEIILQKIKMEKETPLQTDYTIETFIEALLQADPRRRPSDKQIKTIIQQLKTRESAKQVK